MVTRSRRANPVVLSEEVAAHLFEDFTGRGDPKQRIEDAIGGWSSRLMEADIYCDGVSLGG